MLAALCLAFAAVSGPPPTPAPSAPEPPAGAPATAPTGAPSPEDPGADAPNEPEPSGDVTRYSFTGLDIDGELRTPALLQFLARIAGEFETVGIPHRSFMPELRRTASADAL